MEVLGAFLIVTSVWDWIKERRTDDRGPGHHEGGKVFSKMAGLSAGMAYRRCTTGATVNSIGTCAWVQKLIYSLSFFMHQTFGFYNGAPGLHEILHRILLDELLWQRFASTIIQKRSRYFINGKATSAFIAMGYMVETKHASKQLLMSLFSVFS